MDNPLQFKPVLFKNQPVYSKKKSQFSQWCETTQIIHSSESKILRIYTEYVHWALPQT